MKSPPLLRDPSANPSNQTIILSSPASISVCKGESRTYRRSSANLKAVLHHVKSSWTADERVVKLSKKAETLRSCLCLKTLHIRKSDFNIFIYNISVAIFLLSSNFHICHQAVLDLIFCSVCCYSCSVKAHCLSFCLDHDGFMLGTVRFLSSLSNFQ